MIEEKKVIVYKIHYENQNFWAYVSNFLHKFCKKEVLTNEEVDKVFTKVLIDSSRNVDLARSILDETIMFRAIAKPEKLYDVDNEYECLICIYIEARKLYNVVELYRLYLICKNFEEKRILVIIEGNTGKYFEISHFLEWINEQNEQFYNHVFFYNSVAKDREFELVRMQRKRAYAFERMLPLLEIDETTDRLLRKSLHELAEDSEIRAIWDDSKIKVGKLDLKNSALRQLQSRKELFINCKEKLVVDVLRDMNLLTLILFTNFLIQQKEPYTDIKEIYKAVRVLKKHAQGYLQLTENILFHTKEKVGVFSFRLLEGDAEYVQSKYDISEKEKKLPFYEVCISDYAGKSESGNLAQTFQKKLENEDLKNRFANLLPIHFFQESEEMDEEIRRAWEYYYDDVNHIGSHFGLKIFRTLVQQSGGKFVMESYSTHCPGKGESLGVEKKLTFSMPGTSYSILMPVNFEDEIFNEQELDFGIANAIGYENDISKISDIQISYNNGLQMKYDYSDAVEKQKIVNRIQSQFECHTKKKRLMAVDATSIPNKNAELIYKALVKMARDESQTKYVAFYNCAPEFVREFWNVAYSLFMESSIEYILKDKELQIILYTKDDYGELIIVPNNYKWTLQLNNQINFTKETQWKELFLGLEYSIKEGWQSEKERDCKILPFDVMIKIEQMGVKLSIFEHYTKKIVDRSIQGELLGCKFNDTHMRLGSTIHVGQFYEAELLFGVNLFVERFAFLMALDLKRKLKNIRNLTLYGYAAYSEQLIYKLRSLIHVAYPNINVDYAILEREAEQRADKIRYSTFFVDDEKRIRYFKNRKVICIVPISSTLKTNEKLINMFCEENGEECRKNILEDYEVILVGNQENNYWEIVDGNRIMSKKSSSLKRKPQFFIRFDMIYEESLQCNMCFPKRVLDEVPLIEVNAASTIPNQAFGIQKTSNTVNTCTIEKISELEKEMRLLEDCFLYSHIKNGDAHFLFYVQTNLLMIKRRSEIEEWLREKKKEISFEDETYNVIFCPTHTRNVGFAESINEIVFDSTAIIIHDDIDKEYRSNFFAKYSNLYLFIKKISEEGMIRKIRFFYADDAIITGRSFQRAKSLLKSIVEEFFHDTRTEYCVFDSIFVMVDRNSADNRKVYMGDNWKEHFFAFCSLHISSLRNHGDACVLCNLENDAGNLKKSSASMDMYKYWEGQQTKFAPDDVEIFLDSNEYKDKKKRKRAFRRLVCANEAGVFLSADCHGNRKDDAMICILQMMINGCNRLWSKSEYDTKEEMQREYFLSYCKILSRPFVVFNKAVKEAIFDFLLIFTEKILTGRSVLDITKDTTQKVYLRSKEILQLLMECESLVSHIFGDCKKDMELLHVLLKQLTELKSNYIIRLENINKIAEYIGGLSKQEKAIFYKHYMTQIKKLLGVSSDTSKSAWFDYLLFYNKEYSGDSQSVIKLPDEVYEQLYIENNRVVSDAILKLCQKVEFTEDEKAMLNEKNFLSNNIVTIKEYEEMEIMDRLEKQLICEQEEELIHSMANKIEAALESYLLKDYREVLRCHMGKGNLQERKFLFPVVAQILLYQYIEENFNDKLLDKSSNYMENSKMSMTAQGNQLAIYLNYILRARKTYILAESVPEAGEWEDSIIERYNTIVRRKKRKNLELELKNRKEYLVLGKSLDNKGNMIFADENMAKHLKKVSAQEKFKKKGYDISEENHILVWKLGMEGSQVYVCSELEVEQADLNDIRNALMFSYQLNHKVFNVNNTEFFMELIATTKNLSYSLGKKVITHTPYMIRMQQYQNLSNDNITLETRKKDIIMLLADLNISAHYRESLRREYYIRDIEFTKVPWKTPNPVFENGFPCKFLLPIGEMETRAEVTVYNQGFKFADKPHVTETKWINEGPVEPDDELIWYKVANPDREILLMLYLLIMNSAVGQRSEITNGKIEVFLSKTADGEIRISNKLSKSCHVEAKNDFLEVPPYDEEGISIWTVSRYLKSFAATILNRDLLKLEKKLPEVTEEELLKMRKAICNLPEQVQVRVQKKYVGEEAYFSIVLPLLAEKYGNIF